MSSTTEVRYSIDATDHLIFVNEEWMTFARANEGENLTPEHVLHRSLWEFISDPTTRQLYKTILQNVRQHRAMHFTLRCDGPEERRLLEMYLSSPDGHRVDFLAQTIQAENRPLQRLLEGREERSESLIRSCSWCNRIDVGQNQWKEVEEAVDELQMFEASSLPKLTHGICPECHGNMVKVLARAENSC